MDDAFFEVESIEVQSSSSSFQGIRFQHVARIITWLAVLGALVGGYAMPWLRLAWPNHSVGLYSYIVPFLNAPIQLALLTLVVAQIIRIRFSLTSYVLELFAAFYLTFWSVMFRRAAQDLATLYVRSLGGQQLGPIHVIAGAGVATTMVCSLVIVPGALIGLIDDAKFGHNQRAQVVISESEW